MATILVVEDTQSDAERVRAALEPYRWNLRFVTSSTAAKAAIAQEMPVAIVMDIMLPDDTGFQLCRDIKSDSETQQIPIVMCSSKTTDIDRFWAMKQGAAFFLPKPVDPKLLSQHIRQLVPEPSEEVAIPEPVAEPLRLVAPVFPKLLPAPKETHLYARWQFLAL